MSVIMKVATHRISTFAKHNSDTWHMTSDGARTWCGRDCSEWLRLGELEDHELESAYCCTRCYKKATAAA